MKKRSIGNLARTSVHKSSIRGNRGFTIVELLIVVVVIAILAAITIVSYNGITNRAKSSARASDISSWKKKSELHKVEQNITCPENYSFVYGSVTYGTSDFCVMKYEAKNVGGVATSQAAGVPWASISQPNAAIQASAVGGRLLTDAEWMTIAADVMSVKYNWSGGEVGEGYLYQGHINHNPSSALAASTDDSGKLFGITGGTGSNAGTNSSRVLQLTSGDVIWDFSGNVSEWTASTISSGFPGLSGQTAWAWLMYDNSGIQWNSLPVTSRPTESMRYHVSKGVGALYSNPPHSSTRVFMRGGSWATGVNAGVMMLYLDESNTAAGPSTGFRVAR